MLFEIQCFRKHMQVERVSATTNVAIRHRTRNRSTGDNKNALSGLYIRYTWQINLYNVKNWVLPYTSTEKLVQACHRPRQSIGAEGYPDIWLCSAYFWSQWASAELQFTNQTTNFKTLIWFCAILRITVNLHGSLSRRYLAKQIVGQPQ